MGNVPVVQLLDIGDAVNLTTLLQRIGVFAQKSQINNPSAVIVVLEMRIGEAYENLLQLVWAEVVGEVAH